MYSTTTCCFKKEIPVWKQDKFNPLSSPPSLGPPPPLFLMICFGKDERHRVSILGMQDRLRMTVTLLGLLWPFGGTVLTRSKRTLFSLNAQRSKRRRGRGCSGEKKIQIRQNQRKGIKERIKDSKISVICVK